MARGAKSKADVYWTEWRNLLIKHDFTNFYITISFALCGYAQTKVIIIDRKC